MSHDIKEESVRETMEKLVNWHIDRGYVNRLPNNHSVDDYCKILPPEIITEIVDLQVKGEISYKSSVLLMKFYMVIQYYQEELKKIKLRYCWNGEWEEAWKTFSDLRIKELENL